LHRPLLHLPPALRHRKFALLWASLLISYAGSNMQLWTLYWHLRDLSDQPVVVSGIGLARFIPMLAFALFGGLVADLFNRRHIMFVSQLTMMAIATALGALTHSGVIQIWHIFALTAVQAVAAAFDIPARQSIIPNLVSKEDLPNAFSMSSIAINVGAIIGPGLSGLVISRMGLDAVYWINAISYIAVLVAVLVMGKVQQEAAAAPGSRRKAFSFESIREGIQFILHQPMILSTMLLDFFATFFSTADTLLPFVARDILRVDEIRYGWLAAAPSLGAMSVGLVVSQMRGIQNQGRLLLSAVTIYGAATILFGISQQFLLAMVALFLIGAGDSLSAIIRNTIRQIHTPDRLRGRAISVNQIFFLGGPQLGDIEAGLLAQAFGTPIAIITGGIGCILAVIGIAQRWPQLRSYNGDEPRPATSPEAA